MMRTPKIERIKVGDYYVYTTDFQKIKDLDDDKLIKDIWSDDYLGSNKNEDGVIEDQGPGVHFSLDVDNLPYFANDPYWFALTFARSLRSLEGKNLDLLNSTLWIIAAQDEHTPYWHTHRKNIADPRIEGDDNQVDSTYSFSFYLNTLECGSPYSDLLFAHKEDVYSMPVTKGKMCFFDGDVFHKPKLVPKEFGWRYCIAGDLLFHE